MDHKMRYAVILTQDEMSILAGLIDNGVKHAGLRSVKDAAKLMEKLEGAQEIPDGDTHETGPVHEGTYGPS